MSRRALLRPALISFLAWIAIAEIFNANFFLAINTIAAAVYVLIEPWLRDGEPFPPATDDTPLPSSFNHDSAFVAGAVATRER